MRDIGSVLKSLVLGRPVRSEDASESLLPKRLALPVFAADALSSVAYAPDEVLLTLALAGGAAVLISPWVGIAVAVVLIVVVLSYRQTVHAFPSGGGDYEVVTASLGSRPGRVTASALLVDYVMTVAVSVASGAAYAASVFPALRGNEAVVAVLMCLAIGVLNLRGVRESGKTLAVPVYGFIGAVGLTLLVGLIRWLTGTLPQAESAAFDVVAAPAFDSGLVGLAGAFLIAKAFASGSAALTGVEAISNGVPAFKRPKSRNAATTLGVLGIIAATTIVGMLALAAATGVTMVENPAEQLTRNGEPVGAEYVQHPALVQLATAVFSGQTVLVALVTTLTGLVLMLAANAAFSGFPILASVLARDGYLPRQLHARGDKLAFSNGILILGAAASALVILFDASVTRLIQLYVVGVFVSFTLSQLGMVRYWTKGLRKALDPAQRRRMFRSRVINMVGCALTGLVLVIVLVTKFAYGAWMAVLLMALIYLLMGAIRRHYDHIFDEVAIGADHEAQRALPSRVHAIVLVSRLHRPAMRAIAYARASRPSTLEAVTVAVYPQEAAQLLREWDDAEIPVPLRVLDSPYRELTRPLLQYIRSLRRRSPRDLVVVYIPEYALGHWWERLLHNNSLRSLQARLKALPGVIVSTVPWQIASATASGTSGTVGAAFVAAAGPGTVAVQTRGDAAAEERRSEEQP